MKVGELIAELQKYSPDEEVFVMAPDWYADTEPSAVKLHRLQNKSDDEDNGKLVIEEDCG